MISQEDLGQIVQVICILGGQGLFITGMMITGFIGGQDHKALYPGIHIAEGLGGLGDAVLVKSFGGGMDGIRVTPAFPQIFDVPETVGELGIFFPTGHRTILSAAVWPRGIFGYKKYTLVRMLQG